MPRCSWHGGRPTPNRAVVCRIIRHPRPFHAILDPTKIVDFDGFSDVARDVHRCDGALRVPPRYSGAANEVSPAGIRERERRC